MLISFLILIIIATIGNSFFNLTKKYNKSKIGYVSLGIVSFIIGMFFYFFMYWLFIDYLFQLNRYIHEFISFAIGVMFSIGLHYVLEKKWKKQKNVEAEEAIKKIGKG